MRFLTFIAFLFSGFFMQAQVDQGLVTYVNFDDCTANESRGNTAVLGVIQGSAVCECGVNNGQAIKIGNGGADHIFFSGTVNEEFRRSDFSVSFYMKPQASSSFQTQTVMAKIGASDDCPEDNLFAIRYIPSSKKISVIISENVNLSGNISGAQLTYTDCWQHIVVVRDNNLTQLYINGELAAQQGALSRVDITNTGLLTIGKSYCSVTDANFQGLIDELRVYNRPLDEDEVSALYYSPDKIATPNSRIFLGESLDIDITQTCVNQFSWSPTTNVDDPEDPNTSLSPEETTIYTLSFQGLGCTASDTIRVVVIDPNTLVCNEVFLPSAFTPNGSGPIKNETFGISNAEIFTFGSGELISFEIYDRWGNLMWEAAEAADRWDGNYRGERVNPGVYLYRVRFICDGTEDIKSGSITVMR